MPAASGHSELATLRGSWIELIIAGAKEHNQFFPALEPGLIADRDIEE
jgi:hypothetical protein